MVSSTMRAKLVVAAASIAALTPAVYAAELVTLSNGYAMRCDHHAQVEGHVRLYLNAGEDNYMDVAASDVAGYEPAPDPRTPQPDAQPAPKNSAKLTSVDLREMLAAAGAAHNL